MIMTEYSFLFFSVEWDVVDGKHQNDPFFVYRRDKGKKMSFSSQQPSK